MTKNLLFGASSIYGYNIALAYPEMIPYVPASNKVLLKRGWKTLNLEETDWIKELLDAEQPDVILYCHAVCDVPKCEADPTWTQTINVGHVERLISQLDGRTRLVYLSSDHVFGLDGTYTESSDPCPISEYGRSRVAAEKLVSGYSNHLIIRAGLAIGASPEGRTGHQDWLLYRARKNLPITIISNEGRSLVDAKELADRIVSLARSSRKGIQHVPAKLWSRKDLADHLISTHSLELSYKLETKEEQAYPHIGRIGLASDFDDDLSQALHFN